MAVTGPLLYCESFLVIWLCITSAFVSCNPTVQVGPQSKTVVEGDRVSLICDLNNVQFETIHWTHMTTPGLRRYISSNGALNQYIGSADPRHHYQVIIRPQEIYELVILSMSLPEAGMYDCGYTRVYDRSYISLASATITVLPIIDSLSCRLNHRHPLGSELSQEYEVACSWTHSQPGEAHFISSYGEIIDVDLRIPGRIISRIKSCVTPTIECRFILVHKYSSTGITVPCNGGSGTLGLRVDPFISEVVLRSNASFICTFGNQFYSPDISWGVSVNESVLLVSQERLIENEDVLWILNVQDGDQFMAVQCQAHISEDIMVSSYASIRIIEVTTLSSLEESHPPPTEIETSTRKHTNEVTNTELPDNRVSIGQTVATRPSSITHKVSTEMIMITATKTPPISPPCTFSNGCRKWIAITVIITLILLSIIFIITYFLRKELSIVHANTPVVSPSKYVSQSTQEKEPNSDKDPERATPMSTDQTVLEDSSGAHSYSDRTYRLDVTPISRRPEPNYEIPTSEDSLQIPLKDLKNKHLDLEIESSDKLIHMYETIQ